jgi:hypothetical protein
MRSFPILTPWRYNKNIWLRAVPWAFVEPARARIESNHGQTLEQLAQRGGLDWIELFYGLQNRKLDWYVTKMDIHRCHDAVMALLAEWSIDHKQ